MQSFIKTNEASTALHEDLRILLNRQNPTQGGMTVPIELAKKKDCHMDDDEDGRGEVSQKHENENLSGFFVGNVN